MAVPPNWYDPPYTRADLGQLSVESAHVVPSGQQTQPGSLQHPPAHFFAQEELEFNGRHLGAKLLLEQLGLSSTGL
jgi:hypothetical protein